MSHLSKLGNRISIPIKPDEDGFTGRECPHSDCEGYFKIELGTGLEGRDTARTAAILRRMTTSGPKSRSSMSSPW